MKSSDTVDSLGQPPLQNCPWSCYANVTSLTFIYQHHNALAMLFKRRLSVGMISIFTTRFVDYTASLFPIALGSG